MQLDPHAITVGGGKRLASRLPNHSSIFSAEAIGIVLAMQRMKVLPGKKFIIFSDSKSCLQDLQNLNLDHPVIGKILKEFAKSKELGYDIRFCWLPSHVGIEGNERADRSAKHGLSFDTQQKSRLPPSDFKPVVKKYIDQLWQKDWVEKPGRKLFEFCKTVNEGNSHVLTNRRDQTVYTRCCIGHTRLTHANMLKGEDEPFCVACNTEMSIKHILLDCIDFTLIRQRFYKVAGLQELFNTVKPDLIIDFLKAAGLHQLL